MLEIREIEKKFKKIEKNEWKLETLCSRVDYLENLSSRYNNNNGESQVITVEQLIDLGNSQEHQVNSDFWFSAFSICLNLLIDFIVQCKNFDC
jgi:hypothetical protein